MVVSMWFRSGLAAAILLAGLIPAGGEAATRMSFSSSKSFHPGSDGEYSTVHPGLGATGRLAVEWLRWHAGAVRHSHTRWGPFTGVAATWKVTDRWRVGLTAGLVGNHAKRRWVRRVVLPIVQWQDLDRDLVWEFAFRRNEQVTFASVNLKVPSSLFTTR